MMENRRSSGSLKWEEFFDAESEDLLPGLLGVYDSIAAKSLEKPSTDVDQLWTSYSNEECAEEYSEMDNRHLSSYSVASLSSTSSAVSSGKSINSLNSSSTISSTGDCDKRRNLSVDACNSPENIQTCCVNFTTSSEISEDSGVYGSLQRNCSSHYDDSWYCESSSAHIPYTSRVTKEILDTESAYVNDLQQIIVGYLDEWKSANILTDEQLTHLFGNIQEIYNFNRCFLWELKECHLDAVKIAKCFVENNANFSIYATYCTNYPRSVSVLTDLMRQEKTVHIFRERQMSLHHTLPLGSYLLKPVQRILKYHLLLQNMVKYTAIDADGYNDITVALSTMTGIAQHINNMKRKHEHAVRVQEVQSLLIGWTGEDLTTYGELYAEGSFRISGAKALRHIFLFEHLLLVTKKKDCNILYYKTHVMCSNLMLVECIPNEPLNFQIIPFDNPRLQFTIQARSLEEKRHWSLELKRVILENYSADIPSHARQLVMELGQTHDTNKHADRRIRRKRSTPQYLEKRRHKTNTLANRFIPKIAKTDILTTKIRRKLRKNEYPSENSILSSSLSLRSSEDGGSEEESGLDESTDEFQSTSNVSDDASNYDKKEKAIDEIIGQLLADNKDFQNTIKDEQSRLSSNSIVYDNRSINNNNNQDDDNEISRALSESYNNLRNILKYVKDTEDELSMSLEESLSSIELSENDDIWLKQENIKSMDDKRANYYSDDCATNEITSHPEYKFYRTSVAKIAFKKMITNLTSKLNNKLDENDVKDKRIEEIPCFKQGSSSLGARIAHGNDIPDYADPQTLFVKSITNSKKAASLLGINCKDHDLNSFKPIITPQFNHSISLHKPIKIPPPVPIKPKYIKRNSFESKCIPTRGWVKHMVQKLQSTDEF